jgi:hypothetical protein
MVESNESRPYAQRAELPNRTLIILYGTETGNSQEIAEELGRMAERLHFETVVDEMDSFGLVGFVFNCRPAEESQSPATPSFCRVFMSFVVPSVNK